MSYQEVFQDIFSNCDVLISSLKEEKDFSMPPCEQDLKEFHLNLLTFSKSLSHEATKFAIAHSSPPFPDVSATQNLAGSLCNVTSQLVGCYLLLPYSCGSTFLEIIRKELEALIEGVKQFAQTIQNLILKSELLQPCLVSTGILWEFCDRLPNLPQNNREAVVSVLNREGNLIKDALEELENALQSDHEENDEFADDTVISESAIELLPSVKGLIKSAAALIRRSIKLVNEYDNVDQCRIDPVVSVVSTISTEVDDLICSLYSPINLMQTADYGNLLASKIKQLLSVSQMIASEDDKNWIDLLTKAVEHNLTNLLQRCSMA